MNGIEWIVEQSPITEWNPAPTGKAAFTETVEIAKGIVDYLTLNGPSRRSDVYTHTEASRAKFALAVQYGRDRDWFRTDYKEGRHAIMIVSGWER